jgi:hypothetical protein
LRGWTGGGARFVFADLTGTFQDDAPHEAIVRVLEKNGLAGAAVFIGIMGYGRHRRIHTRGLFGVVDAKPITILYLDDQEKIMAVLPVVLPMVKERLVAVQDIERVSA